MDLMSAVGWLAVLNAARKLRPGALLWAGCPCSTWIWMSRGSTGRSRLRPGGHARKATLQANRMIRRLCYMLLACEFMLQSALLRFEYARSKRAYWCVEQPASSLLPFYKPFEAQIIDPAPVLAGFDEAAQVQGLELQPGRNGSANSEPSLHQACTCNNCVRKPTVLITNAPWLFPLGEVKMSPERRRCAYH